MAHPVATLRYPAVAGILNVTPDSFSDGGTLPTRATLLARATAQLEGGASILDVGGESTRPGFAPVAEAEELRRVVPAITWLREALPQVVLSVDTRRVAVAAAALAAGAHVINDVGGLRDPGMARLAAAAGATLVLMHGLVVPMGEAFGPAAAASGRAAEAGASDDAAAAATAADTVVAADDGVATVAKVLRYLAAARDRALAAGVAADAIWLDPGVGFGKTPAQSWALTGSLAAMQDLGCRVYYGPSRKGFLGAATGQDDPLARDAATAAACAIAVDRGADVVRVHAPEAVRDAVAVGAASRRARATVG